MKKLRRAHGGTREIGGYEVGPVIGRGSSGCIYKGKDLATGDEVAIKLVEVTDNTLMAEASFYRRFSGMPGVPRMRWYGRAKGRWAMVVDRLSVSLGQVKEDFEKGMPVCCVCALGVKMLRTVQSLHERGVLHRDIKPQNFMLGIRDQKDEVFLIDFGLSAPYIDPLTGAHSPPTPKRVFSGTPDFASTKVINGQTPSRRDDLESLLYTLIYLLKGSLPWQGLGGKTSSEIISRVREKKNATTTLELCANLPPQLGTCLDYVKNLSFSEEPDYQYIHELLTGMLPGGQLPDEPLSVLLRVKKAKL